MRDKEREEIQEKEKEYKEYMKQVRKDKYAHERIDKEYEEHIKLPEIKWEEKIKNEIKSLHRPIRKDELDDHERLYQEAKRNKDK